jgi:hypothetical protein
MPVMELPPAVRNLSPRARRRLVARSVLRTVATVALLFVLYALVPLEFVSFADTFVRLFIVLVILGVVFAAQVNSIVTANYPILRAMESLVTAIMVFIVLFALFYLGLASVNPASFNQPLTRVSALYFTVTVLATVGFGDITAQTDVARLTVTVQMLLGLVVIAVIVRVFTSAARAGVSRRDSDREAGRR